MNLSFQKQFVDKILSGTKIHTIREDKHIRWGAGRKIHFCTGLRTKNYKRFYPKNQVCNGTQVIEITWDKNLGIPNIRIDGKYVNFPTIQTLAINDGFENYSRFFEWFNKDFSGKIIHWTDFRY